jgi:hypothetical protein
MFVELVKLSLKTSSSKMGCGCAALSWQLVVCVHSASIDLGHKTQTQNLFQLHQKAVSLWLCSTVQWQYCVVASSIHANVYSELVLSTGNCCCCYSILFQRCSAVFETRELTSCCSALIMHLHHSVRKVFNDTPTKFEFIA